MLYGKRYVSYFLYFILLSYFQVYAAELSLEILYYPSLLIVDIWTCRIVLYIKTPSYIIASYLSAIILFLQYHLDFSQSLNILSYIKNSLQIYFIHY